MEKSNENNKKKNKSLSFEKYDEKSFYDFRVLCRCNFIILKINLDNVKYLKWESIT